MPVTLLAVATKTATTTTSRDGFAWAQLILGIGAAVTAIIAFSFWIWNQLKRPEVQYGWLKGPHNIEWHRDEAASGGASVRRPAPCSQHRKGKRRDYDSQHCGARHRPPLPPPRTRCNSKFTDCRQVCWC
jgi:hypothetical protein